MVSALTSSITQGMMNKLGGLENRLAKELASSQSRDAIGRAMAKGVTIDINYHSDTSVV